jgi:hypothetical protein
MLTPSRRAGRQEYVNGPRADRGRSAAPAGFEGAPPRGARRRGSGRRALAGPHRTVRGRQRSGDQGGFLGLVHDEHDRDDPSDNRDDHDQDDDDEDDADDHRHDDHADGNDDDARRHHDDHGNDHDPRDHHDPAVVRRRTPHRA